MENKSCLVIVNQTSSGAGRRNLQNAIRQLQDRYGRVDIDRFRAEEGYYDVRKHALGYDAVAICGGDGTFHRALNALKGAGCELVYLPCGTMNDLGRTLRCRRGCIGEHCLQRDVGEWNGTLFSYVAATGTFTPIGYRGGTARKRKFGRLVYYLQAFKEYRRWHIRAEVCADGAHWQGEYTLVMALHSRYVFGLPVNRAYCPDSGEGWLLLIDTPHGVMWRSKLFWRFFRAFVVGFRGEYHSENIRFLKYRHLKIVTETPLDFCVDGEHYAAGRVHLFAVRPAQREN